MCVIEILILERKLATQLHDNDEENNKQPCQLRVIGKRNEHYKKLGGTRLELAIDP